MCFNVGCFYLQYEMYASSPHLEKEALNPHYYYNNILCPSSVFVSNTWHSLSLCYTCVEHVAFLVFILHVCLTRGIPCPSSLCVSSTWYFLDIRHCVCPVRDTPGPPPLVVSNGALLFVTVCVGHVVFRCHSLLCM